MNSILEIEFKGHRRDYFTNSQEFPFKVGDMAVVQVEKGEDLGAVSHLGWKKGTEPEESPLFQLLRKALPEDLEVLQKNREKEKAALIVARQKAREHKLEMKFVDVELQWDGRKMTFFFTADGRIDFRELVKDFASTYRTRIDLRQIGARDETKKKCSYGICGRQLCCATWLTEFHPITTQMPRDQFLPLNPMKLSGICGRLKCCLRYELETYKEFLNRAPVLEQKISDPAKGEGVIEKLDMVSEQVYIRYQGGELEKLGLTEFQSITDWTPGIPKEQLINICARPKPIQEEPPVETTPKQKPAGTTKKATPKPKKKKSDQEPVKKTPKQAGATPLKKPKSAKVEIKDTAKTLKKSSRRRHHRKKKKPTQSHSKS